MSDGAGQRPSSTSQPHNRSSRKRSPRRNSIRLSRKIARWEASGLTPDTRGSAPPLKFEVADMPSIYLGEANGSRIRVDNNAGGNGWFIDASGQSDGLFTNNISSMRGYTDPADAPAGQIDLLTTILHEMGHAIGLGGTPTREGSRQPDVWLT